MGVSGSGEGVTEGSSVGVSVDVSETVVVEVVGVVGNDVEVEVSELSGEVLQALKHTTAATVDRESNPINRFMNCLSSYDVY